MLMANLLRLALWRVFECSRGVNRGRCPYQQGSEVALSNETFCNNRNVLKCIVRYGSQQSHVATENLKYG